MKQWKTQSRTLVHHQPPWLIVEQHAVELPDGRVIPDWPWVITPDYVNVVALTEEGRFICFRQTKYGVIGTTLSVPGGFKEPGEDPLAAAQRELLEETGYTAPHWENLGHYLVDPNRGVATGYLYLARGARKTAERTGGDLEEQELLLLDRPALEHALDTGEFKIMAWSAALAFALRRLR